MGGQRLNRNGSHHGAALNLSQLQDLIRRDKTSYYEEFKQQLKYYEHHLVILKLKPESEAKELQAMVVFISHVAHCYPKDCQQPANEWISLLNEHASRMHPALRKSIVQSLILMRNKKMVEPMTLLALFFQLFRCRDKILREMLYCHIITDIKSMNAKMKNNQLNKRLQNFMYTMMTDNNEMAAKKSLDVMVQLYKKNIWNDAKTVNVIATACFSPVTRIMVTALQFFLNVNADGTEEDEDEDEHGVQNYKDIVHSANIGKKTKKKENQMKKALHSLHRKEKSKNRAEIFNFSALHLVNDPQGFAEKLFNLLKQSNDKFEIRIMIMNLVSRLIGVHQLLILNFYTFLQKYAQPHQRDVTHILTFSVQASHALVPPDVLEPLVISIANSFVAEHCSSEVIAVGLNSIREICNRCPFVMSASLLQDLCQFKTYKDKSVMMAARSLIGLFREKNPELLHKKDRGKDAQEHIKEARPRQYGEQMTVSGIEGTDLLKEYERLNEPNENETADGWEVDENPDHDSEGDWVDVSQLDNENYEDESQSDYDNEEFNEDDWEEYEDGNDEDADSQEESSEKDILELDSDSQATLKTLGTITSIASNLPLEVTRIMTPQDFARLSELKAKKVMDSSSKSKRKTITHEESPEIVDSSAIEALSKKRRHDYEARMASVREGREGRDKYGSRKGTKEHVSKTNREKLKNKNYLMMVHKRSVYEKKKLGLHEKQKIEHARRQKEKKKKN